MYRILQIEDMPSDAYLIKREIRKTLESCEFQVVDDQEAFLAALMEFKPHLIVSDFSIPGFSWQTALYLTHANAPQTPFIIVTGSTNDEIRNGCMKAGVTDFISKNLIQELGPAILKALKSE